MSIAEWGIKNKVFTLFSTLVLAIMGVVAFTKITKLEDPYLVPRVVRVTTAFPGVSVGRMSKLVVKPIEEAISQVPEVKEVFSNTYRGVAYTNVTIDDSIKNIKPLVHDLRNKLADIVLPKGCKRPLVSDTYLEVPFTTIALSFDNKNLNDLDRVVIDLQRYFQVEFRSVRRVQVFGLPRQSYYIEADSHKLTAHKLTITKFRHLLAQAHVLSAGATVHTGVKNILLLPNSEFNSLSSLKSMLIPIAGGKSIPLGDLAKVSVSEVTPITNRIFFNKKRVVILALYAKKEVNLIKLGKNIKASVSEVNGRLPAGYQLKFSTFRPDLINEGLSHFADNLYMAIFIVGICVVVFLTWRAGILVGITVPLTMLITILIMYLANIPLERMTLVGLIISLGLLVDNGMVMVEDIRFAMDQGRDRLSAAISVAKKLSGPLLVSQLTTILAFAPPLLAANQTSEYVGGMSKTVLITLLVSWFLAQWLLPLLCTLYLKPTPKDKIQTEEEIFSRASYRCYKRILTVALDNRLLTLAAVFIIFFISVWAMQFIKIEFFPKLPTRQVYMRAKLPIGSDTDLVLKLTRSIDNFLLDKNLNPNVISITAYVASPGPMISTMNMAYAGPSEVYFLIKIKKLSEAKIANLEARYRIYLKEQYSNITSRVGRVLGLTAEPGHVYINIAGGDARKLYEYANKLEHALAEIPHTSGVVNTWGNLVPSVTIQFNRYALHSAGLSVQDIVRSIQALISGVELARIDHGEYRVPVELRLPKKERNNLNRLKLLKFYSSKLDRFVELQNVATIKLRYLIPKEQNFQRIKSIGVEGYNTVLGEAATIEKLKPAIQSLNLPIGYKVTYRGAAQARGEANEALFGTAAPCIALIFFILVYQFRSVRKMLILLFILPLASIGVVLGLVVSGVSFGFMPTFGVIALIGLIINDGVILLEAITEGKDKGLGIRQSLLTAGQQRLRPILLTTATTVLGMLPLVFNGGPLWQGLAICFTAGILVATLLLLIMIPVLYSLFFRYWKSVS